MASGFKGYSWRQIPARLVDLGGGKTWQIFGPSSTQFTQRFLLELLREMGVPGEIGMWPPSRVARRPRIVLSPHLIPGMYSFRTIGLQMERNEVDGFIPPDHLKSASKFRLNLEYSMSNIRRLERHLGFVPENLIHFPIVPIRFVHDESMRNLQHMAKSQEKQFSWIFFGSFNERRVSALNQILALGSGRLVACQPELELNRLLIRSRLVVDIPYYPRTNFDVERSSRAVSMGAQYLGESSLDWPKPEQSHWMHQYDQGSNNSFRETVRSLVEDRRHNLLTNSDVISSLPTAADLLNSAEWKVTLNELASVVFTMYA